MSMSAEQQENDHSGTSTEYPRETRDPIEDVWVRFVSLGDIGNALKVSSA